MIVYSLLPYASYTFKWIVVGCHCHFALRSPLRARVHESFFVRMALWVLTSSFSALV